MPRRALTVMSLSAALLVSGCGNGDGGNGGGGGTSPMPPAAGQLIDNPPAKLASYGTADLLGMLGGSALGKELLQLSYNPTCAVDVYRIHYATLGGKDEATTASGALMIPNGTSAKCQGSRPMVLYAHATTIDRNFDIADIKAADNDEGLLMAAVFAAAGYIVVAPNYAGYGTTDLPYHPYLNAKQQSKDMMDALSATRSALPLSGTPGTTASAKLFVTGYSQGGYVAMATQRALQSAGAAVTGAAPLSGPYALAAFGDAIFEGEVMAGAPVNLTLLISSYQHSYGNVYAAPGDVFATKYAGGIDALLPSATPLETLVAQGKLPANAVFSSTPPDPAFTAQTPATSPSALASVFARGFGTDFLIANNYRLAYLKDAETAPDGGFPSATTGVPSPNPANALRKDLVLNDLRNWTPTAPVLLCAGDADPTVLYLNTQLMQSYWKTNPPGAAVTVLDIDSRSNVPAGYSGLTDGFAAAKALLATASGSDAVLQNYHAGLVPPFCLSAARTFFDGL